MATQCRTCRTPIVWMVLPSGSRHPFNAKPRLMTVGDGNGKGRAYCVRTQSWVTGHIIPECEEAYARQAYTCTEVFTSHFATCPQADQHRRRK